MGSRLLVGNRRPVVGSRLAGHRHPEDSRLVGSQADHRHPEDSRPAGSQGERRPPGDSRAAVRRQEDRIRSRAATCGFPATTSARQAEPLALGLELT